jgi:predicted NBD/HSP70 family sugar kinase
MVGEIGHITVTGNGKKCKCGNYGCLETVSSDFAIIDRARNELGIKGKNPIMIDGLIEMANNGNKKMEMIFSDAADYLSISIRNVFAMYDPDEIVINCRWLLRKKDLYFKLMDSLYDDNNLIDRRNAAIKMVDIDDFGFKSAAAIVATHEMESMDSSVFKSRVSVAYE